MPHSYHWKCWLLGSSAGLQDSAFKQDWNIQETLTDLEDDILQSIIVEVALGVLNGSFTNKSSLAVWIIEGHLH